MAGLRRSMMLSALLTVALAAPAFAQTGTVVGRMTASDTGQPLPSALVSAINSTGGTVATAYTNQDGVFQLTGLVAGSYTITVSAIGFGTQLVQLVQVTAGGTGTVNGVITPQAIELDPLVVSAGKKPEKALNAPARVEVISEQEIVARPSVTPVDHLRGTAAVDIVTQGVQSTNVVIRGFNNIFSGATHTLTDNRIAGVPSLRVNVINFIATNNEDLERIEVVLGPGSALYGPNTANGVLHLITKSPLSSQGTVATLAGGEQSILHGTFRTSHLLSENVGFKLSGQYFQADEWPYADPVEAAEKAKFASSPFWKQDMINATGIDAAEADKRIARIGNRDYSLKRWSGEARLDWRASSDATAVFAAGTSNSSQIELTGLGAGQAEGWSYTYFQGKINWNRLFAQVYLNASDAGDTFLLRNGAPIVDKSKLWVGQVQHGMSIGNRQRFTYGVDVLKTLPDTKGTINGKYEDDDETTELGAYLQSETALAPKLDLVLAGRVDSHSALPDAIFSPRAALVLKPNERHSFRVTYNRAFSTPSSLNQFLDLATAVPNPSLAQLGYSVRVQGTGDTGFRFQQAGGGYLMRSPFTPAALGGTTQLLPADVTPFWSAAVQVVAQQAAAMNTPIDPNLLPYLLSLKPTASDIGTNYLNTTNLATGTLANLQIPDTKPIREETSTTFEVGYQGVMSDKFLLAADAWVSKKKNLVTPLITQTPLLLLNPQQVGAYLVTRLATDLQMPVAMAQAIAGQLTPGLAKVPLGVISSDDINATGAQLLASYTNVDKEIDLWGIDVSAKLLFSDVWSASASASWVNDDKFEYVVGNDTTDVTLNAPKFKAAASLAFARSANVPLSGEARVRYTDAFPALSGVYQGSRCLLDSAAPVGLDIEDCVSSYTLLDLLINYELPFASGTSVDLSVQNVFDEAYRSFPGVPSVGRMALLRLRYVFR